MDVFQFGRMDFQVAHCYGFTEAASCYWIRHRYLGVPLWNGLLPFELCDCAFVIGLGACSNNFYVPYYILG